MALKRYSYKFGLGVNNDRLKKICSPLLCAPVFFGLCSVLLRLYKPIVPLYESINDDALYVNLAKSILDGNWLGKYSDLGNITLSKPPGFAIFLSAVSFVPIPFVVIIQCVVVVAAFSARKSLIDFGAHGVAASFGYYLSIFSPIWFGFDSSRVYRDSFLAALMMSLIAFGLLMARLVKNIGNNSQMKKFMVSSFFLGIIISWIRITKNIEIAAYVFVALTFVLLGFKYRDLLTANWKAILGAGLLIVLSSNMLNVAVGALNQKHYGVALTDNYTKGEFPRALNVLASVSDSKQKDYVPLTGVMRAKIYAVSPTFSKLRPFIEDPSGFWRRYACYSDLKICDEAGLWFTWEIREAVVLAGMDNSAGQFEDTFRRISEEVSEACRTKVIACGASGIAPGIGPVDEISPRHVVESFAASVTQIFGLAGSGGESATYNSDVNPENVRLWESVVRGLPQNKPLENYMPGVNAASETERLLTTLYTPIWQIAFIVGVFGSLVWINFRKTIFNYPLFAIGVGSFGGASALVLQLAVADAEMGLFVRTGSAYFLPSYPFTIIVITLGLNSVFRNLNKV